MKCARRVFPMWLVSCALLALLAGEVRAQGAQQSALTKELLGIAVNPTSDYAKAGRAKFVRLVAAYCRQVLTVLPTNTPSEDAWVAAEGQTTDMGKIRRLTASPEYNRHMARDVFSTCEKLATEAARVQGMADRTESTIRYEAAVLVSLALAFHSSRDVEIYASRAGLNVEALGLDFIGSVQRALLVAALRTLENK